ncbi:hypothetical protein ACSBR1_000576 [Camellia fascicularis]
MANDGQKEKVEDNTPTGSEKHIDLDVEKDNCNEETRDKNHEEEDVCQESDVPNKSDRSEYYNEDDLHDTPMPAAKDTQKEGQRTVPVVPQHGRTRGHSHRPSREVGHEESPKTRSRPR